MKTKSTLQSFTQGSMMWEIVLFDYSGKPGLHPIKEVIPCGRRSVASIGFTEPISELIWWTVQSLISILICHRFQIHSWLFSLSLPPSMTLLSFNWNMPGCQTIRHCIKVFGGIFTPDVRINQHLYYRVWCIFNLDKKSKRPWIPILLILFEKWICIKFVIYT